MEQVVIRHARKELIIDNELINNEIELILGEGFGSDLVSVYLNKQDAEHIIIHLQKVFNL